MRDATAGDILDLLRDGTFQTALGLTPVLMSMPIDNQGARLRVAVLESMLDQVPKSITMTIEGEEVLVPIEAVKLSKPELHSDQ